MKILLAVDGSAYTQKMLDYLVTHQATMGEAVEYTALTVCAEVPPRARKALGKETVEQYYAEECEKVLSPVLAFLSQHGITVASLAKVGQAGETIAQIAEEGKYDLIIMGTHGANALNRLVMGSVSTKVLAQCSVPVMLIR
ncbi:universal stress protein [Diaphorobacter aerolatus]|uniref:Universal stress protein n=1 Tax=Diaphorobacter aerolatus TaxID=1288495 RepID=A0A7H0GG07_9BURK|nr:universal stress protein [Diaphorobacter aerolatus]QNP47223.1 universal stress protein [Diaphorobacter aerolatus]